MRQWGGLFFGFFLLAVQKKETCCRAIPDRPNYEFTIDGYASKLNSGNFVCNLWGLPVSMTGESR
jgi:hypothetical protein